MTHAIVALLAAGGANIALFAACAGIAFLLHRWRHRPDV